MTRALLILGGVLLGLAVAVMLPGVPDAVRGSLGLPPAGEAGAKQPPSGRDGVRQSERAQQPAPAARDKGRIAMTQEQAQAAGIGVAPVSPGVIAPRITVPGTVVASSSRLARVPAKVAGTVAAVYRQLGDEVAQGDALALIESREMADAKGEYLAALRAEQLAATTLAREERLWRQRISAERDFLNARAEGAVTRIRRELAQQKLASLGLSAQEIAALPSRPIAELARREIRSPIAGRVISRKIDPGAAVAVDTEAFVVADLSVVSVEMAVQPADLPFVREGATVTVSGEGRPGQGRVIYVSPVLDPDTRSARVVAEIGNADGSWRPGSYATAEIAAAVQEAKAVVPLEAVQQIGGETVVFVRNPEGFEARKVALGRGDHRSVGIVSGLDPGQQVAVTNAFTLKAELGRAEAEN